MFCQFGYDEKAKNVHNILAKQDIFIKYFVIHWMSSFVHCGWMHSFEAVFSEFGFVFQVGADGTLQRVPADRQQLGYRKHVRNYAPQFFVFDTMKIELL